MDQPEYIKSEKHQIFILCIIKYTRVWLLGVAIVILCENINDEG